MMIFIDEFGRMWKEVVLTSFKIISQLMQGGTRGAKNLTWISRIGSRSGDDPTATFCVYGKMVMNYINPVDLWIGHDMCILLQTA